MTLLFFSALLLVPFPAFAVRHPPSPIWSYPLPDFSNLPCAGTSDQSSELGPVRDQGELQWCFAYSAADLITQRVGFRVSAADIAANYFLGDARGLAKATDPNLRAYLHARPRYLAEIRADRATDEADLSPAAILGTGGLAASGGAEGTAALLANLHGLCAEEDLPSLDKKIFPLFKAAAKRESYLRQHAPDQASAPQEDPTSPILDPISVKEGQLFQANVDARCRRHPSPWPLLPVEVSYAGSIADFEAGVANGSIDPVPARLAMIRALDHALDSHRVASVSYSDYAIRDYEDKDLYEDHASVVTQRLPLQGQCRYLVRNSFGADCDDVRDELRPFCDAGSTWLTREELARTLTGVTYLK